jgi:excisionase family DNA binding protein
MNKNDAAAFLEIGIRSLERYTGAGKVQAQKLKVKTGFALDYDPAELERFKAVLEAEKQEAGQPSPMSPPSSPTALAVRPARTLANVVASVANGHGDTFTAAMVTQAIAVKLLLNLAECQALTGLSRATLRDAIEAGDLKAKMIGKAWRVKRGDLEAFVNGL